MLTQGLRRLATALAVRAASSFSGLRLLDATVPSGGVRVTRGVPYGAGPRRALDLYQPSEAGEGRPLVVFFYGGSWKTGARGAYRFVATALARRGMVVAVPDYRLYPETVFPGFLEDAAEAVAWAAENAARHGAAPRPFLVGHSAGAYIALMLALNPAYLRAVGLDRAWLAGAVGIAGPYDFRPGRFPDVAPIFAAAEEASTQPIAYADGANPPLLLLAGGADTTVRPANTLNLAARVAARGGPVATRVYPRLGHIGVLLAFAPLFRRNAPVVADIERFVRAHRG
ncbi:MAG: alpha/beta hydrolase [Acetobacteraceae bacterium]|nr:alpha/beta hydrolase [Acetobacteraceae bacterium]